MGLTSAFEKLGSHFKAITDTTKEGDANDVVVLIERGNAPASAKDAEYFNMASPVDAAESYFNDAKDNDAAGAGGRKVIDALIKKAAQLGKSDKPENQAQAFNILGVAQSHSEKLEGDITKSGADGVAYKQSASHNARLDVFLEMGKLAVAAETSGNTSLSEQIKRNVEDFVAKPDLSAQGISVDDQYALSWQFNEGVFTTDHLKKNVDKDMRDAAVAKLAINPHELREQAAAGQQPVEPVQQADLLAVINTTMVPEARHVNQYFAQADTTPEQKAEIIDALIESGKNNQFGLPALKMAAQLAGEDFRAVTAVQAIGEKIAQTQNGGDVFSNDGRNTYRETGEQAALREYTQAVNFIKGEKPLYSDVANGINTNFDDNKTNVLLDALDKGIKDNNGQVAPLVAAYTETKEEAEELPETSFNTENPRTRFVSPDDTDYIPEDERDIPGYSRAGQPYLPDEEPAEKLSVFQKNQELMNVFAALAADPDALNDASYKGVVALKSGATVKVNEKGDRIQVSGHPPSTEEMMAMVKHGHEQWGQVCVSGSREFQINALIAYKAAGLPPENFKMTFKPNDLEQARVQREVAAIKNASGGAPQQPAAVEPDSIGSTPWQPTPEPLANIREPQPPFVAIPTFIQTSTAAPNSIGSEPIQTTLNPDVATGNPLGTPEQPVVATVVQPSASSPEAAALPDWMINTKTNADFDRIAEKMRNEAGGKANFAGSEKTPEQLHVAYVHLTARDIKVTGYAASPEQDKEASLLGSHLEQRKIEPSNPPPTPPTQQQAVSSNGTAPEQAKERNVYLLSQELETHYDRLAKELKQSGGTLDVDSKNRRVGAGRDWAQLTARGVDEQQIVGVKADSTDYSVRDMVKQAIVERDEQRNTQQQSLKREPINPTAQELQQAAQQARVVKQPVRGLGL